MNQLLKSNRVDVVDALRGFAVVAILLLHFIEHFMYGVYPQATSNSVELMNQSVWDSLFFLFAGKSYAIFATLFGFTFVIQQRNQEARGAQWSGRFAWRLVILMLFATLNAAFFPGGDVLMLFAIMGFVMIPLRRCSTKALLVVAVIFLIQPIELLGCFGFGFDSMPTILYENYYPMLKTVVDSGDFWSMVWANITTGQVASLFWAIDAGRLLQVPGLFILGMILARGDYFNRGVGFWVRVFVVGFLASVVFYVAKSSATESLQTLFTMWYNVAFMAILVSIFVILYQSDVFQRMTSGLRFYGRMSLTNYVSQSIVGSIIFFPYAFGLASSVGVAWSLVIGLGFMYGQILFCRAWLKTHKQGPLEAIWRRLTWLK